MELAQITQQAQDGTRRLIELIGAAHGVELDVSGRSLGWLDDHIEAQRETWQRELLPEKLDILENMLGCYLGECLVTLGGRWVWMENQPAVELETKPDDDGSVEAVFAYPFTRLEKHVDLGGEHSIEAVEDSIFLSTAFPIRCLTGARVLELIADLVDWHAELSEAQDEDESDDERGESAVSG